MIRILLAMLMMSLLVINVAFAEEMSPTQLYRQGVAAYEVGKYDKAITLLEMAIDNGIKSNLKEDASCKILDLYLKTNIKNPTTNYRCKYNLSDILKVNKLTYDTNKKFNEFQASHIYKSIENLKTSEGLMKYLLGKWVQVRETNLVTRKRFITFNSETIDFKHTSFSKLNYYDTGEYKEKVEISSRPIKYGNNFIVNENMEGKNDKDQYYKLNIFTNNFFCFPPIGAVKDCFERIE